MFNVLRRWISRKEQQKPKDTFQEAESRKPAAVPDVEIVGTVNRPRSNKVAMTLRTAIARGAFDSIDASPALQRNQNIIEELENWHLFASRKEYLIQEMLKYPWTIENCPEFEEWLRKAWGTKIDDILELLPDAFFYGKSCVKVFPQRRDYLYKHPSFVTAQVSRYDPEIIEFFIVPTMAAGPTNDQNSFEPVPIYFGDYILCIYKPKDKNLGHGEGFMEKAYSLKRDYDEIRGNWRRFSRKFSVPIFKYFYNILKIDPVSSTATNQANLDAFMEAATETGTAISIPLALDDQGNKTEDIELVQVQNTVSAFIDDFRRIKEDLTELLTKSNLAMGISGVGSYAAQNGLQTNVINQIMRQGRKLAEWFSEQFVFFRWNEQGGKEKFPTTNGEPPLFKFVMPDQPELETQVTADLQKFDKVYTSNTKVTYKDWYSLLHIPVPKGINPEDMISASMLREEQTQLPQSFFNFDQLRIGSDESQQLKEAVNVEKPEDNV